MRHFLGSDKSLLKTMLILVSLFFASLVGAKMFGAASLPPLGVFYQNAGWTIFGTIGSIMFILTAVCFSLIGIMKLIAIRDHPSPVIRRRVRSIVLTFFSTSFWTLTISGIMEFGGYWHIAFIVFGIIKLFVSSANVWVIYETHKQAQVCERHRMQ